MILVGLTGNYGSGKSTVARMFCDLGARTLDADEIVRRLLVQQDVIKEIAEAFGAEAVPGGAVDKQFLAEWVFRDAHARITLEDILHPRVFRKIDEEISQLSYGGDCIVIVEATVIFERGYQGRFDRIITVFNSAGKVMERLKVKGVSEEDAKKRLDTQLPLEIKMRGSDFIIDNAKDIENTREQVRAIYQALLSSERKDGNN